MTDLYVKHIPSRDPRLGRHVLHDPRSRGFALPAAVDRSTWVTKLIRVYDPVPNPDQVIGDCTGCAKAMQFNAVGNRRRGVVLGMDIADKVYSLATKLDSFPGTWEPDDTGSSLLAAAKASQMLNLGGRYEWIFGKADGVVQAVMAGKTVNVGTEWMENMFQPDAAGRIEPTGASAGGHSWIVRGYDAKRDWVRGRCWWGSFRDFYIKREHLNDLLANDGECLVQQRKL